MRARAQVPARRRGGTGENTLPVTHSIPAPAAILAAVATAYAIGEPVACELIWSGLNDTYQVTTDVGRYIARVYRAGWRSAADVMYEMDLLVHLAGRGVPVAAALPGRDGALARTLRAPEGDRELALFQYAGGEALRWKHEDRFLRAGRLLAQIHNAADDFDGPAPRFQLDAEYLIAKPLAVVRPFLAAQTAEREYLEQLAGRLAARLEAAARTGLDWGVCHGDFGGGNINANEDGKLTVFDFDICGPGWRAYDLASIKLPAEEWSALRRQPGPFWTAFLRGYGELRAVRAADHDAVPLFHAIRHFWGMGLQASNVGKWGSKFMNRWYFDFQFKFFRLWEAEQDAPDQRQTVAPAAEAVARAGDTAEGGSA